MSDETEIPRPHGRPAVGIRVAWRASRPAVIAIIAVLALQLILPDKVTLGAWWVVPAIEAAVLVTLLIVGPTKLDNEARDVRWVSLTLIAILSAANAITLALLIDHLLKSGDIVDGRTLIYSAVAVWFTSVLSFGLWYWEIDRGGPIRRCRTNHGPPDLLFPQMESPGVSKERWTPRFVDYLYVFVDQFDCLQPNGRDAADTALQVAHGHAIDHQPDDDRRRRRPRREHSEVAQVGAIRDSRRT